MTAELDQQCINTLRFLSVDMVQQANSGHPGLPLGAAPMAYVLWMRALKFNPRNPHWAGRDVVLPPSVSVRLAVEAGVAQGWHRYVGATGDVISVERFGASAPAEVLLREYGFTVDNVCARAKALLA